MCEVVARKIREAVARLHARQSFKPDYRARRVDFVPPDTFPSPPPLAEPRLRDALAEMANAEYCLSVQYQEQQTRAVTEGAHPDILDFARLLVKRFRVLNVPLYAHCVWRSEADQMAAYVRGNSKVKFPNSAHNGGCAVDIVHGYKHWGLSKLQWSIIGHVGFEVAQQNGFKLVWGGDDPDVADVFDWDPAHWELKSWRQHRMTPPAPRY